METEYIVVDNNTTYIDYIQRIEILQKQNNNMKQKLTHNDMLISQLVKQIHPKRIRILEKQLNIKLFHLRT